jgi:putative transposase
VRIDLRLDIRRATHPRALPVQHSRLSALSIEDGLEGGGRSAQFSGREEPRIGFFVRRAPNLEVFRTSPSGRCSGVSREKLRRKRSSRAAVQAVLAFKRRGGARPGSGRKRSGPRALVPHRARGRICADEPILVTIRLVAGLKSLRRPAEYQLVRSGLQVGSEARRFQVVFHSVQSNHIHLIVESRDRATLATGMKGLKVRLARSLNRHWQRSGSIFADRYHARSLRTPREVRNALVYVLHNARKHGLSYQGPDLCSSGPWFDGWASASPPSSPEAAGTLPLGPSAPEPNSGQGKGPCSGTRTSPATVRARTWLLGTGWKRWGLIGLEERPAQGLIPRGARKQRTQPERFEANSPSIVDLRCESRLCCESHLSFETRNTPPPPCTTRPRRSRA